VDSGKSDHWRHYYETIFSLTPSPGDSSLLQSPDGLILLRMNEAGSSDEPGDTSVQDYLDVHHGPGIQSVALTAENPAQSLQQIQVNGVSLTSVCPGFAYEIVPAA
jgi:4-hydroxyphenylpyruvate dioxygenase-like putative hemolysin